MQQGLGSHMLAFADTNMNLAQGLFNSEGYFWLTAAVASSFAEEELIKYDADVSKNDLHSSTEVLAVFNQCIRNNQITQSDLDKAKQWTKSSLDLIYAYNGVSEIFNLEKSLVLSKCFTTYWLIFKLIEIEWQEVLGMDEVAEAYQFLDTIIADSEELEEIEQRYRDGQSFSDDQRIYLRSHWHRVSMFWSNLYNDLMLLAEGFLTYETSIKNPA